MSRVCAEHYQASLHNTRAVYGKFVTLGVTRGEIAVGPPVLLMTLLISPLSVEGDGDHVVEADAGVAGTSMARVSTTSG